MVATIAADANNKLNGPEAVSFDGERVLVTNNGGGTVTLFKAADLSFIANVPIGSLYGACSDGINFWVTAEPPATCCGSEVKSARCPGGADRGACVLCALRVA